MKIQQMTLPLIAPSFIAQWKRFQESVHENAKAHGWWSDDEEHNDAEKIALMHAELSEVIEAMRNHNPPSDKIPGHSCVAEELADVVIRVADFCERSGIDLGSAIIAKLKYNEGRPFKHGGKAF